MPRDNNMDSRLVSVENALVNLTTYFNNKKRQRDEEVTELRKTVECLSKRVKVLECLIDPDAVTLLAMAQARSPVHMHRVEAGF